MSRRRPVLLQAEPRLAGAWIVVDHEAVSALPGRLVPWSRIDAGPSHRWCYVLDGAGEPVRHAGRPVSLLFECSPATASRAWARALRRGIRKGTLDLRSRLPRNAEAAVLEWVMAPTAALGLVGITMLAWTWPAWPGEPWGTLFFFSVTALPISLALMVTGLPRMVRAARSCRAVGVHVTGREVAIEREDGSTISVAWPDVRRVSVSPRGVHLHTPRGIYDAPPSRRLRLVAGILAPARRGSARARRMLVLAVLAAPLCLASVAGQLRRHEAARPDDLIGVVGRSLAVVVGCVVVMGAVIRVSFWIERRSRRRQAQRQAVQRRASRASRRADGDAAGTLKQDVAP